MASVLDRLPHGGRVAVIRLRSLGDCVLTTPALDLLKRARPDLSIAVVVEDRFREIFEGNPDIETLLAPRARQVRAWAPQLALNLHGGGTSAWLTAVSGAKLRAGFGHFRYQPIYNVPLPRAQQVLGVERKVHTAEHLASAVFWLGVPPADIPRAKLFAAEMPSLPGPYAVIHPTASRPAKTWSAEGFAAVAAHLERAHGIEPLFVAGPGEDLETFRRWRRLTGARLSVIKSLLSNASFFIGNDSGPAHMAAAFGLPLVALFGSSDAEIWYPWKTTSEVIAAPPPLAALPLSRVLDALDRVLVHA